MVAKTKTDTPAIIPTPLPTGLLQRADFLLANHPGYPGSNATLRVQTLGGFRIWYNNVELLPSVWGREKAIHLFQFLLTLRRQYAHKEQIIDRLWPDLEIDKGDRDFKVALNAVNKALEPKREAWGESNFVQRRDLAYSLNMRNIWLDSEVFELLVEAANEALLQNSSDEERAIACYDAAVHIYKGEYLPDRLYEDWSSAERERLQLLAFGAMIRLGELLLSREPLETIRLTQRVLHYDPVWEDAYRLQMRAYMIQGNRPLALRTYEQCEDILEKEFGVPPLPETSELYQKIRLGTYREEGMS
ncbi:MAG: bacterial transcriptional activator domain-containing protein [Caldilineaceae bacterium]